MRRPGTLTMAQETDQYSFCIETDHLDEGHWDHAWTWMLCFHGSQALEWDELDSECTNKYAWLSMVELRMTRRIQLLPKNGMVAWVLWNALEGIILARMNDLLPPAAGNTSCTLT